MPKHPHTGVELIAVERQIVIVRIEQADGTNAVLGDDCVRAVTLDINNIICAGALIAAALDRLREET